MLPKIPTVLPDIAATHRSKFILSAAVSPTTDEEVARHRAVHVVEIPTGAKIRFAARTSPPVVIVSLAFFDQATIRDLVRTGPTAALPPAHVAAKVSYRHVAILLLRETTLF
jgi:hypothetical protein